MTDSLWDVPLAELRARTASASPTPGGGSVAAVTAALGCSLVLMALEITARRGEDPAIGDALAVGRALLDRLGAAADRDVELFEGYLRARRLPRSTDDERATRQVAVAAASTAATEGPLTAAADVVEALGWALAVLPVVARAVVSDVHAGADLLLGSALAALRGAEANVALMGDDPAAYAFAARLTAARRAAVAAHDRVDRWRPEATGTTSTPEGSR
ncbi:cyclodeaminase/cyclohydrolase family protein [Saccharothrix sp. HUAS TT1]|uniref:cyclodeaminase/cyclohydrolase family protein n=1 Tax=unclassified Saccharothrix TaxID=2593673 RepID=UPI00345B9FBB